MKLLRFVAVAALVFAGNASAAEPINWQRYIVAETGASVDIPTSIFTEDAGKPEGAYGKQLLTSDGRANLTIESLANEAGDSPAAFLAPSEIRRKTSSTRKSHRVSSWSRAFATTRSGTTAATSPLPWSIAS
jgi:hypothetical protein